MGVWNLPWARLASHALRLFYSFGCGGILHRQSSYFFDEHPGPTDSCRKLQRSRLACHTPRPFNFVYRVCGEKSHGFLQLCMYVQASTESTLLAQRLVVVMLKVAE